jgi:hypothetical protein
MFSKVGVGAVVQTQGGGSGSLRARACRQAPSWSARGRPSPLPSRRSSVLRRRRTISLPEKRWRARRRARAVVSRCGGQMGASSLPLELGRWWFVALPMVAASCAVSSAPRRFHRDGVRKRDASLWRREEVASSKLGQSAEGWNRVARHPKRSGPERRQVLPRAGLGSGEIRPVAWVHSVGNHQRHTRVACPQTEPFRQVTSSAHRPSSTRA